MTATLEVFSLPGAPGLPTLSPFCLKLETWLRMAGIEYRGHYGLARGAPKGKFPFIQEADGRRMGDSALIIEHLTRSRGIDLDAGLSEDERARGHVVRRTLEEFFYWGLLWTRWGEDAGWQQFAPVAFGGMPAAARALVAPVIRRSVIKSMRAQGIARHTPAERLALLSEDLAAVARLLGEREFFHGRPTPVDAAIYGQLGVLLQANLGCTLQDEARKHPNLVRYCERMKARYWGQG